MSHNGYPILETVPLRHGTPGEELVQPTMLISRAVALGATAVRPHQRPEVDESGHIIEQRMAA